mgnify:CR=1 FL=1
MGDTTRKKRVKFQGIEVEPQEVALIVKYEVEVVATTDGVATTESRQSTQTKIRVKTLSESSNVEKLAKQIAEKCKLIPDSKVPLVVNKLYELQFQVTGGGGESTAPNEGGGGGPSAAEQEAAEREERDRQYRQEQDARAREDEDRRRREDDEKVDMEEKGVAIAAAEAALFHGGCTFAVEPGIEAAGPGSYGKNSRAYREPSTGDSMAAAWQKLGHVEAMSPAPSGTVATFTKQNMLAKAVHAAFYGHHPLVLSPDVIWLTIAQGLANHVDQNAEKLRSAFVNHEGKELINIERPDFVKGSPHNDWAGVFPEFSAKIREKTVAGTTELIENDFSTTGPAERIVSHITLMDTVQHYFTYTMSCGCGFPAITLTGTPADWEKVRAKAQELQRYDLEWWLEALLPALDQFVLAAHGKPDLDFWRSLCNINTGTSFPCYEPLTGWIQAFFPYLNEVGYDYGFGDGDNFKETKGGVPKRRMSRNDGLANFQESFQKKVNLTNFNKPQDGGSGKDDDRFSRFSPPPAGTRSGVKLELFPPAMSSAPFTYKDLRTGKKYRMAFCGGLTALVQHPDGSIEPKVGWAVLEDKPGLGEGGATAAA